MNPSATNSRVIRQARARRWARTPSDHDMQLLSSYVFGHITLAEANELLHERGPFIIAICDYELATA